MNADFAAKGYLSAVVTDQIGALRAESAEIFALADDTNLALQAACVAGLLKPAEHNFSPETFATRLALRSCGNFQGAILMAERGMVTESLTLTRSLIENSFCIAGLLQDPEKFVEILKSDAQEAYRLQAKFVVDHLLDDDPVTRAKVQGVLDGIGKKHSTISPKKNALGGPLRRQYLVYQKLSNDAAHPSIASLNRHLSIHVDEGVCDYRWGLLSAEEIRFSVYQATSAAIQIGVGFTEMIGAIEQNEAFSPLLDRFRLIKEPDGSVANASKRPRP